MNFDLTIIPMVIIVGFIIFVIAVFFNFCRKPSEAKAVRKFDGWYVSVKRIKWDDCDNEEELQEFYHDPLTEPYPFLNEDTINKVVEKINKNLQGK